MSIENEEKRDVQDVRADRSSESNLAGVARDSQLKTDDQKQKELEHQEKRAHGLTASSAGLPDIQLVAQLMGKPEVVAKGIAGGKSEAFGPSEQAIAQLAKLPDVFNHVADMAARPESVGALSELAKHPKLIEQLAKNPELVKSIDAFAKHPEAVKAVAELGKHPELVQLLAKNPDLAASAGELIKHPERLSAARSNPGHLGQVGKVVTELTKDPQLMKAFGELSKHPELLRAGVELARHADLVKPLGELAKHPELLASVGTLAKHPEQLRIAGELAKHPELIGPVSELAKHPQLMKGVGELVKHPEAMGTGAGLNPDQLAKIWRRLAESPDTPANRKPANLGESTERGSKVAGEKSAHKPAHHSGNLAEARSADKSTQKAHHPVEKPGSKASDLMPRHPVEKPGGKGSDLMPHHPVEKSGGKGSDVMPHHPVEKPGDRAPHKPADRIQDKSGDAAGHKKPTDRPADKSADQAPHKPTDKSAVKSGHEISKPAMFGKPEIAEGTPGKTTKDAYGRVDSITYADGKSNKFEYDKAGKLSAVKSSDGTSWKHEEGLWFKYDDKQQRTDHFDGKMYVTQYGEIVQKNDIYTNVTHRDGRVDGVRQYGDDSKTTINADRSEITTQPPGRISRLKYPDGKLNDFEYDSAGKLSSIKNSDGTKWVREDKSWVQKDGNGKALDRFDGTFSVDRNGDIVQRNGDAFVKTTHRNGDVEIVSKYPDNTTRVTRPDNSKITTDQAGRVVEMQYPDKTSNEFKYDQQGKLSEVKNSNGSYLLREKGHWYKYDKNKRLIEDFDGDLAVDKKGDIVAIGKDSDSFLKNIKPERKR